jgi:hypothetical protein
VIRFEKIGSFEPDQSGGWREPITSDCATTLGPLNIVETDQGRFPGRLNSLVIIRLRG